MGKHQKHTKLARPEYGTFAVNEIGILGGPCGMIQNLAKDLLNNLDHLSSAYIDAKHGDEALPSLTGATKEIIRAKGEDQWLSQTSNAFDIKEELGWQNLVLVNANHFDAKSQIVILHPDKLESLQRKTDRLTNVIAFVHAGHDEIPEFVKAQVPNWASLKRFDISDVNGISDVIQQGLISAPLYGLVLAGGESKRMGHDKGQINYHGLPQREHLYNLLADKCEKVFTSCRMSQQAELLKFNPLPDRLTGMGPFGAIATAFMRAPDAAWLVVACDLPNAEEEMLDYLIKARDLAKIATSYTSPDSGFPEPLAAIWEPSAYPRLMKFLTQGYSCPRKVLINSDIHQIDCPNPSWLLNVNHPEELSALKSS